MRNISHTERLAHTEPLFKKHNILKVVDQINFNKVCFTFNVVFDEVPTNIKNMLQKRSENDSTFTTRMSQSSNIRVPYKNKNWFDSFPAITFAKSWNALPVDIRDISLFRIFKQTVLHFYLEKADGMASH